VYRYVSSHRRRPLNHREGGRFSAMPAAASRPWRESWPSSRAGVRRPAVPRPLALDYEAAPEGSLRHPARLARGQSRDQLEPQQLSGALGCHRHLTPRSTGPSLPRPRLESVCTTCARRDEMAPFLECGKNRVGETMISRRRAVSMMAASGNLRFDAARHPRGDRRSGCARQSARE
jgi:hypothetical protein